MNTMAFVLSTLGTVCIGQKNGRKYRIWTLINAGLWALYDLTSLSFGPLCTHLLQVGMAVFGMVIHDRKGDE